MPTYAFKPTNWFPTSRNRVLNLALVTDITFVIDANIVTSATVYFALADGNGQFCYTVSDEDARHLHRWFY